ncbi:hypothetical protein [Sphingobium sp.]|uniref:hypothetical protein n=1 Tax=Sphingobium sp. TaxID=1912891 RepID=UPI002580904A|nr:hypothetical protein [Sphingobium sp.]
MPIVGRLPAVSHCNPVIAASRVEAREDRRFLADSARAGAESPAASFLADGRDAPQGQIGCVKRGQFALGRRALHRSDALWKSAGLAMWIAVDTDIFGTT